MFSLLRLKLSDSLTSMMTSALSARRKKKLLPICFGIVKLLEYSGLGVVRVLKKMIFIWKTRRS